MRWGVTLPLTDMSLAVHRDALRELEDLGYTDLWSAEVNGVDAFTPLALAAAWTTSMRLGTAIVPAFTRGPALIAMSAMSLAEASGGRFVLGVGASSPAIVESWNGLSFDKPFAHTRDILRFARAALTGDKVTGSYDTFDVSGFRLELPPSAPVPIYLAALRSGMLKLAGAEADGVILNWLAATDVPTCLSAVANEAIDVVARIFVVPSEDIEFARMAGRRMIAAYLTVPGYAAFHAWLGRSDVMGPMWAAWAAGDRKGALAAIPDDLVDSLVVHGSPEACRDHIARYCDAGVKTPVAAISATKPGEYDGGVMAILRRMVQN